MEPELKREYAGSLWMGTGSNKSHKKGNTKKFLCHHGTPGRKPDYLGGKRRDCHYINVQNSLGMVTMDRMKVEEPGRLPLWGVYNEIMADAIGNWHTTITANLKMVIMNT
jgi:hypothetical protein